MAGKRFHDPYAELIDNFNRRGVRYVVIGMAGINYYASDARGVFSTQDFDIFVMPAMPNIKKAIAVFQELGYSVMADEREISGISIKDIVRQKHTIVATDAYGIMFELLLAISGYTFSQIEEDAAVFDAGGIPIKVAKLNKLLMSKKIAGRDKDRLFLKRFRMLLKEKRNQ